ncbi:unnamed protein product [Prorocentrum cordatum]|uniref:RNA-directed RNA polymerase n=1 Tax=Prorocentrum cordatum TaxID=2364126 RepID=A0ABN9T693_9DINO|nr:unnamed protein product [Polarella glacialis]
MSAAVGNPLGGQLRCGGDADGRASSPEPSDSEVAMALQASLAAPAGPPAELPDADPAGLSDADLARALQARLAGLAPGGRSAGGEAAGGRRAARHPRARARGRRARGGLARGRRSARASARGAAAAAAAAAPAAAHRPCPRGEPRAAMAAPAAPAVRRPRGSAPSGAARPTGAAVPAPAPPPREAAPPRPPLPEARVAARTARPRSTARAGLRRGAAAPAVPSPPPLDAEPPSSPLAEAHGLGATGTPSAEASDAELVRGLRARIAGKASGDRSRLAPRPPTPLFVLFVACGTLDQYWSLVAASQTCRAWPDCPLHGDGAPSCRSQRPLREVVVRLGERRAAPVRVVRSGALLLHLRGSFDRFALLSIAGAAGDVGVEPALRAGVEVCGEPWSFFGCSSSMLRAEPRRVYLMRGSAEAVDAFRAACFPELWSKAFPKQLKYAGLLMSQCRAVMPLPDEVDIQSIDDVERNGHCFTDGCGSISLPLALRFQQQLELEWCPSVWQIRYCGHGHICKGILLLDKRAGGCTIRLRKSMQKALIGAELEVLSTLIGIVGWSKPHTLAKLNQQAVALLSHAVPETVLEEMHAKHMSALYCADTCPAAALTLLSQSRATALWQKLCLATTRKAFQELLDLRASVLRAKDGTMLNLSIPVADSRILFGACDPELQLEENTCYVCVTVGETRRVITGPVVIYRSPSYSPGDIRVLQAVDIGGEVLEDCILFSASGTRPAADTMSGGDLDGDLFAVFWDARITRYASSLEAVAPPDYSAPPRTTVDGPGDIIEYITHSEQSLLGRIDALFWRFASSQGVASPGCTALSSIFSRAVDKHPEDSAQLDELERGAPLPGVFAGPWGGRGAWSTPAAVASSGLQLTPSLHPLLRLSPALRWEGSRVGGRHAERCRVRRRMFEQARLADSGCIACSCVAQAGIGQQSSCSFDCENTKCPKSHPAPLVWIAAWRARAHEQLRSDDVPVMRECKVAERVVQQIYGRLQELRSNVAAAETAAAARVERVGEPGSAEARLAEAIDAYEAAKSGRTWRELDELAQKALLALQSVRAEQAGTEAELRSVRAPAARLEAASTQIAWTARPGGTLRQALQAWRRQAERQVRATVLEARAAELRAEASRLERERRACEACRDASYSEAAAAQATAAAEAAEAAMHTVHAALESFAARVSRSAKGLTGGSQEELSASNAELRSALTRERRRLLHPLPVHQCRQDLLQALRRDHAVVLTAGTGSGKSTQVPGFLVDDLDLNGPVVCTQPRRLAARSLAERVAEEFDTELGGLVGYHVGSRGGGGVDARRASAQTALLFVTDGLLLHNTRLHAGAIVVDEAHERSKDTDLILARWRQQRSSGAEVPPLVVMSASIDAGRISGYLRCTAIDVPGRLHDVDVSYSPPDGQGEEGEGELDEEVTVARLVDHACRLLYERVVEAGAPEGDVLIFLPGCAEVEACVAQIEERERLRSPWAAADRRSRGRGGGAAPDGGAAGSAQGAAASGSPAAAPLGAAELRKLPEMCVDEDGGADREERQLSIDAERLGRAERRLGEERMMQRGAMQDLASKEKALKRQLLQAMGPMAARRLSAKRRKIDDERGELQARQAELTAEYLAHRLSWQKHLNQCASKRLQDGLGRSRGEVLHAFPLFSALEAARQDRAIQFHCRRNCGSAYVRKVVCCTNIAETSLTIPGVRYVIDAGVARQVKFDHELRCSSLCLVKTSKAAATQRAGRAGRVAHGWCFRLFSSEDFDQRRAFEPPEMEKIPVERLLLHLCTHGFDISGDLGLLDPPPPAAVAAAKQALVDLGFLREDGCTLTEDGRIAARLDLGLPWSARMLLESGALQCTGRALLLAALLEDTQVRWRPEHAEFFSPKGDPFSLLNLWAAFDKQPRHAREEWCRQRRICRDEFALVRGTAERLRRSMVQQGRPGGGEGTDGALMRALVRGFFQFFAVHHDERFPRAGYSVLTPLLRAAQPAADEPEPGDGGGGLGATGGGSGSIGDASAKIRNELCGGATPVQGSQGDGGEREGGPAQLLKVDLCSCSSLRLQGDCLTSWVLFAQLRSTRTRIVMSSTCAVTPAMLIEEAPGTWRERVHLQDYLDGGDLSLLKKAVFRHVGPAVMRRLLRDRWQLVKEVEQVSGARWRISGLRALAHIRVGHGPRGAEGHRGPGARPAGCEGGLPKADAVVLPIPARALPAWPAEARKPAMRCRPRRPCPRRTRPPGGKRPERGRRYGAWHRASASGSCGGGRGAAGKAAGAGEAPVPGSIEEEKPAAASE